MAADDFGGSDPTVHIWKMVALTTLWAALVVVPFILLAIGFRNSFYLAGGTPPSPSERANAHEAAVWFGISVVAIPAVGCVLAALWRWRVNTVLFGIVFVVASGLVLLGLATNRPPRAPTPEPVVTQCIPISGGHGCPGG